MARTVATLPVGSRITDFISLGVIAKNFPIDKIHAILRATGKASLRQRDLPAHVVIYYVIALALYMQSSYREVLRCLLEGIQWLDPSVKLKVAGRPQRVTTVGNNGTFEVDGFTFVLKVGRMKKPQVEAEPAEA